MNLNDLLPIPEGNQSAVAMEWLDRWQKAGNKPLSATTVESRLSELRKEKLDGVRFFYNDAAREKLLAEVLGLEPVQRENARKRAEDLLQRGGQQAPRLVLALAGLSTDTSAADQLFQQIKKDFLGEAPVLPLTLVVDELQYDRLPRSFDDLKPRLAYVKVGNAEEGSQKAEELAGEGAVVGRSQPLTPYSRWLALAWQKGSLIYAPTAGPQQLRESGRVPAPPSPTHDAEQWLEEKIPTIKLPTHPVELRKLVDSLGDPAATAAFGALAQRVALGRALGVKVAATDAEIAAVTQRRERSRIEAELAALQKTLALPLTTGGAPEVERLRQKAGYAKVEPTLFRVQDQLHLVGNADLKVTEHPRLVTHREEIRPTSLQRLLDEVDAMTIDDWRADPLLSGVIWRLAPKDEAERLRLFHARAGLVLSGALEPAEAEGVEDWRGALAKLLAGDPPAAKLLPQVEAKPMPWLDEVITLKPWIYPDGKMFFSQNKDCPPIYWVPPLLSPAVGREQKATLFVPNRESHRYYHPSDGYYGRRERPVPNALVPVDPDLARDPEVWMELVQASPFLLKGADPTKMVTKYHEKIQVGGPLPDWNTSELAIPPEIWRQADRELATAWIALRRAVRQGEGVELHDGKVLLDMGGGVVADLEVRSFESEKVEAALWVDVYYHNRHPEGWRLRPLTARVDTHLALTGSYTTHLGYALPTCITLTGAGIAVDLRFFASPLLAAATPSSTTLAAVAAAAATVAEEEERAYQDDD